MQLKSLKIRRAESYESFPGFIGELETDSPQGKVTIKLSDEACRAIVKLAAQGIMEAAQATASLMVREVETLALVDESPA